MRLAIVAMTSMALMGSGCFGQDGSLSEGNKSSDIALVQKAAIAALNFRQGDAAGLNSARADFTLTGWKDFMRRMDGFLDDRGAPTFTSSFVPSRGATILEQKDGVVHFRIPGKLTQSSHLGRTTYDRFAIEVNAVRDPAEKKIKIQRLEQITCRGASSACE